MWMLVAKTLFWSYCRHCHCKPEVTLDRQLQLMAACKNVSSMDY
jgi:hypothetical protein